MARKLEINKRFRDLIPPLADEERRQLEANIVADGCRDPLVIWRDQLIDGHNRYEICNRLKIQFETKPVDFISEDDACIWIVTNQFGRRNLAPFTRVELALKLESLLAGKAKEKQVAGGKVKVPQNSGEALLSPKKERETAVQLAKLAGVSHDTVTKGKLVAKHADEETKHKLRTNQISVHRVAKDIKEKLDRDQRQTKRTEAAVSSPKTDDRIIVGDFREHADKVADGSLSLIFTDPPYDRQASKMLPELGQFAAAKLADGGSLVLYVGQTQIPAALDALRIHLRYWWTIACVHSGRSTVMREYGINAGWKAVLWFVKGTRDNNSIMVNDVMSGGEEKSHHDWQQSESEAAYWIEKLCPKDGLVCDPFLGGGTTAVAAQKLGRKWIAFEVNEDTAAIARKRVTA